MKAQYSGEAIEFMKKRGVGIVLKRFLRPVKSPGWQAVHRTLITTFGL